MATEKQISYINMLLEERDHTLSDVHPEALSIGDASTLIGSLKSLPMKAKDGTVATLSRDQQQIADGMYIDRSNMEVFKVQLNKASGDGSRPYAKRLVIEEMPEVAEDGALIKPAKVKFRYEPGLLRQIKVEWRMTMEEAEAFGTLYGVCVRCGRTLTDETSIDFAMGPVCRSKI